MRSPFHGWLLNLYLTLALVLLAFPGCSLAPRSATVPNILLILTDDLGYGDVSAYNDQARVTTRNLDALAAEGMRFIDAHSPSTVCTPTRYSILTGQMAFRTGMTGVFTGVEGPCLINQDTLTLPQMLQDSGYTTALFGKWHLGMSFFTPDGQPVDEIDFPATTREERSKIGVERVRRVDFSQPIPDGPLHRGFEKFFGTVACPTTDWLYSWVDGDRVPMPPLRVVDRGPLPKHPYANDNRPGMISADFDLERVDMVFLEKSLEFLKEYSENSPDKPFFLFHSMQAVHLPSFAAPEFRGQSEAGPHGDFLYQMDYIVGELMIALRNLGLEENTLVIFTSDNGPEVTTTFHMRQDHQHDGARPWRGMKRDQWEGGHRIPLLVRWPGRIPAGSTSEQTLSLTDIMATLAAIVGYELPNDAAEDSYDFSSLFSGRDDGGPIREYTLHQTNRLRLAIRMGDWKYLDHKGSGGNDYTHPQLVGFALKDSTLEAPAQLYNLKADPGETRNLYFEQPELAARLKSQLDTFVSSGRSAPLR